MEQFLSFHQKQIYSSILQISKPAFTHIENKAPISTVGHLPQVIDLKNSWFKLT